MKFQYHAIDANGLRNQGEITAENQSIAVSELALRGLLVSKINENKPSNVRLVMNRGNLGLSHLERFTTEVAMLLRNGVRIDKALSVLARNTEVSAEKRFLVELLDRVRGGESLSAALQDVPDLFSDTYINLVRAGEASGRLDDVFLQLSKDLKFRRNLQNQVLQAVTYPMVILFVCLLSIVFVFNYIVPQMAPLFSGAATLPGYTMMLLYVSEWFRNYQLYVLLGVIMAGALLVRSFRSHSRRDQLLSRLTGWPLIGGLILQVNQIQANSTLSITLASGLPIDRALGLAANSVKNREVSQSLWAAQDRVRRGDSTSSALRGNPLFPDFAHSLIEVGEEGGDLQPCFQELTDRARTEFELRVGQLTSILEPLLILFMGGVVGGVVVTMLLSVVSVNDIAL